MTDQLPAVSPNPETISLRQLLDAINARGVEMAYSTLSELLKTGDIAQQLGIRGGGNKREIDPEIAGVLAAFITEFKSAGGKTPQAPAMLRAFLRQHRQGGGETGLLRLSETTELPFDLLAGAREQGRAQGLAQTEQALTASEAADLLRISVRMLRRTVPPFRRFGSSPAGDRWLRSDLLTPKDQ